MANPRMLTKRRKAVRNIRKITRTMQLIATARFQKALVKATQTRPYADTITELVQQLQAAGQEARHPLLNENPDAEKTAVLVITSNRGLCGGYNASLLRLASEQLGVSPQAKAAIDLQVFGKKGVAYFKFLKRPMARAVVDFPDTPEFAHVEPIASELIEAYTAGKYSAVHVVYMHFITAAKQVPACTQLLPIRAEEVAGPEQAAKSTGGGEILYDFSPAPKELLAELLPAMVKVRLYQCFTDATVSEQVARMVAMKSATDAADEMIKLLTRQYNRARQSRITSELLDIIGGVEAMS